MDAGVSPFRALNGRRQGAEWGHPWGHPAQAFELGCKLEKAERALQREYIARHSAGFAKAEVSKAEAERLRARNLGRAA